MEKNGGELRRTEVDGEGWRRMEAGASLVCV